jgi:hypothetical protein
MVRDGRALALAYIDARDVQDRLDRVCGPQGWQAEHFDAGNGRLGCKIGVFVPTNDDRYGQWLWKSDGAGNTDVEGDKGAFSDSFKRAAVHWGVGRYLYSLGATWVPCDTLQGRDGKPKFKKFTADPWAHIPKDKRQAFHGPLGITELKNAMKAFAGDLAACEDSAQLKGLLHTAAPVLEQAKRDLDSWYWGTADGGGAHAAIVKKEAELEQKEREEALV